MRDAIVFLLCVGLLVSCYELGHLIGWKQGNQRGIEWTKQRAVDHGAARWIINQETGEREFEYIGSVPLGK